MAYRNGTYIAFHAQGTADPTESDMKYYNLLKAWNEHEDHPLYFVNSHEKTESVRDSSKRETLRDVLVTRLRNSKNMVLIIGQTTRFDTDWIPFEISYAIDECEIPIIAAYPNFDYIMSPGELSAWWPAALASRIQNGSAHVIHVPFRKEPLVDAIPRFSHEEYPVNGGLGFYSRDAYRGWGFIS
jgi:hypothetical protein